MTAKESGNGSAYRILAERIGKVQVDVATVLERQSNIHIELTEIKKVLQDPTNGLVTHQMRCQERFVPLENGYRFFKWIGGIIGATALTNIVILIYSNFIK